MPSIRRIPDDKRRSRTGCLPCRKRRRRCDEKKPHCANCLARHVQCSYKDWTFVAEGPTPAATPARGGGMGSRSNGDDGHDDGAGGVVVTTPGSHAHSFVAARSVEPATVAAFDQPGAEAVITPLRDYSTTPAQSTIGFRAEAVTPGCDTAADEQIEAAQLAVILSHFRYKLASWMDAAAPRSTFATDLLVLANDAHPLLLDAVAGLVARHNRGLAEPVEAWRRRWRQRQGGGEERTRERTSGEPAAAAVAAVTDGLVSLHAFFGAPVAAWRTVATACVVAAAQQRDDRGLAYLAQPLQTLVRVHVKIDLGSALLGQTVPQLGLSISTVPATAPDGSGLAPQAFYDACLAQLADCLALCAARDAPQKPVPHQPWLLLWTRCLRWYETRPPAMAPIARTGRLAAAAPRAASDATSPVAEAMEAAFPTEVYTSVLAVQASIVTHLALALLLTHKPRLLSSLLQQQHPARLASRRWHAQTVAAVAASNHFFEQGDPVVVAALLWVARDMTHPVQQQALAACLVASGRGAGIDVRDAVAQLQAHWQGFRQPGRALGYDI